MRKIKYILTLLTAVVLLLPGMPAEAATTKKELASGTKNTMLTITLKNYQSIEGKVSVKSKTSGKTIILQSVSASTDDKTKTVICEAANGKLYMVSNGDTVTTTVTMNVQFSGDGSYTVALKGGCTDKDGKYKADGINETIKVTVGAFEASDDEEETEEEEDEKDETEDETEEEKKEDDKKTEEKDKSPIKTPKTDTKKDNGKTTATTREETKVIEEDERLIEQFLEEAEEEYKKEIDEKKEEVKNSKPASIGSFLNYLRNFWFIFLILFIFLLICVYLLWKLLRKNRKNDYDGAPMVDYRIEDDD